MIPHVSSFDSLSHSFFEYRNHHHHRRETFFEWLALNITWMDKYPKLLFHKKGFYHYKYSLYCVVLNTRLIRVSSENSNRAKLRIFFCSFTPRSICSFSIPFISWANYTHMCGSPAKKTIH